MTSMFSAWQSECLIHRLNALHADIARVARKEHPYPEPRIAYEALQRTLRDRLHTFSGIMSQFANRRDDLLLRAAYDTIEHQLRDITRVFTLLQRVDSVRTPFELLTPLAWGAQGILGTPYQMIVRLEPTFNYSIVSLTREFDDLGWSTFWRQTFLEAELDPSETLLLGMPSAYSRSVILNALASHELGHEVYKRSYSHLKAPLLSSLSARLAHHSERLQDYLAQSLSSMQQPAFKAAYGEGVEAITTRITAVTVSWSQEIFADLIGARLLGPAYMAALERLLINQRIPTDLHPPASLRRRVVVEYLDEFLPHLRSDEVWGDVLSGDTTDATVGDYAWRIASEVSADAVSMFAEWVNAVPSPLAESPDLLSKALVSMEDHIDNLSPPSVALADLTAFGSSLSIWLLFYAAWHYRLSTHRFSAFAARTTESWHTGDDSLDAAETTLGNLILQAMRSMKLNHDWARFATTDPPVDEHD